MKGTSRTFAPLVGRPYQRYDKPRVEATGAHLPVHASFAANIHVILPGQLLRVRVEFMDISEQQLLAEVEDILRTMPARETLGNDNDEVMAWIGRASALIHAWSSSRAIFFDSHVRGLGSPMSVVFYEGARGVLTMLNEARHDLRLKTVGPL